MSSNINITTINENFPIAGQDNSSQGFRDNFNAIKTAFSTATNEITNLQVYSAKLNDDNDFSNKRVSRVKIINSGFVAVNSTPTISDWSLNYTQGNYHKATMTVTTATNFSVTGWPAALTFCQLRLEVVAGVNNHRIGFTAPNGTLLNNGVSLPYVASANTRSVWDLWSTDGGLTVFVQLVGGSFA